MTYVFGLRYGIDIPGYHSADDKHSLTNATWGGEIGPTGIIHSEEWRKKHSKDMSGEGNPMYGVNVWDTYSEEKADEVRRKLSEAFTGENNPNYGNHKLHERFVEYPELLKLQARPGAQNGRARKVRLYDPQDKYIGEFGTMQDACKYIKDELGLKSKPGNMIANFSKSITEKKKYRGYRGEFV